MLQTLQAGRGIAAIFVAAFHLSIGLGDPRYFGQTVLQDLTWRGNLGVDFFFVLSGFIIMMAHEKDIGRPERWSNYALKRFIRVFPIYWLYTGVFAGLLLLGFGTVAALPTTPDAWFLNFSLIRLSTAAPILAPAWTLCHELFFYAMFLGLIINRRVGIALITTWMLITLSAFVYAEYNNRTPFNTYFSAYNLDFLIGMAAFFAWKKTGAVLCRLALVAGLILLTGTMWLESHGYGRDIFPLLYALGFGGLLAGAVSWESQKKRLSIPVLSLLGNASYSIYLTHEAFEGVLMKLAGKIGAYHAWHPYLIYAAILTLSITAGCLAYILIEKPLLNGLRHVLLRNPRSP